ncbi:MAG: YggT family protein [Deltaproteobacteria bacterium]|nr:YggT family protein [Deltaproteobacteria bacterium]
MNNGFLATLSVVVNYAVNIYIWVLIVRVLLTWVQPDPNSAPMRVLSRLTDPVLSWARRTFPLRLGGLDFSPIILFIILVLLGSLVSRGLALVAAGRPLADLLPLLAIQLLYMIQQVIFLLGVIMAIRVVMSLVNPSRYNPLVLFVYGITEPLLAPLRKWFQAGPRGLDVRALVFVVGMLLAYLVLDQLAMAMRPSFLPRLG